MEDLVEEGSQIKVNLDNREEYCLLYADYLLNKHIDKQFAPFRKGFYKVVAGGIIEVSIPLNRHFKQKNSVFSLTARNRSILSSWRKVPHTREDIPNRLQ